MRIFRGVSILLAISCLLLTKAQRLDAGEATWTVDLKQGSIETPRTDLEGGQHYYAFKGIPFAQPPVGPLRFKNPVLAGEWTGVRNGSLSPPVCAQWDRSALKASITKGSEDCLYLNVFIPRMNASDLPVMVYIHGGRFLYGSSLSFEPIHLLRNDVIVVTIQYRVGVLGFLSTEDSVMPGNVGLKDQVMALRWVQENIESFGGDHNRVTLFGHSVGATSVHYLTLSPMAKGLFHRGIAQSGSALMAAFPRDDHRHNAAVLGQMLECEGVDPKALDSEVLCGCLQTVSNEKLIIAEHSLDKFIDYPMLMVPRVDGEFLPEHPAILIRKLKHHNVDFMMGINRDEGAAYIRGILKNIDHRQSLAQNFSVNGPLIFNLGDAGDLGIYIAKRLFYHYLGDLYIDEENAEGAVKLFTDFTFSVPMELTARYLQKSTFCPQRTFLYEMNYVGEYSASDSSDFTIGKNWVAHTDELQFLFATPRFGHLKQPKNVFMSEIITSLWANFARTGNPTPDLSLGFKWSPITATELKYLILQPSPFMRGHTREKILELFTNLPTKINKLLFPDRFKIDECE